MSLSGGPDGDTPLRDSLLLAGHCARGHRLVSADGMGHQGHVLALRFGRLCEYRGPSQG